jgi:hypothetical protein
MLDNSPNQSIFTTIAHIYPSASINNILYLPGKEKVISCLLSQAIKDGFYFGATDFSIICTYMVSLIT